MQLTAVVSIDSVSSRLKSARMTRVSVTILTGTVLAALFAVAHKTASAQLAEIKTVPERTGFKETSKYADVMAFLDAVTKASPRVHLAPTRIGSRD